MKKNFKQIIIASLFLSLYSGAYAQDIQRVIDDLATLKKKPITRHYSEALKEEYVGTISDFFDAYNARIAENFESKGTKLAVAMSLTPFTLAGSGVWLWSMLKKEHFQFDALLGEAMEYLMREEMAAGRTIVNGQILENQITELKTLPSGAGETITQNSPRSSSFSIFRPKQIFPYVNTSFDGVPMIRPLRIAINGKNFYVFGNMEVAYSEIAKRGVFQFSGPEMMMGHAERLGTVVIVNESATEKQAMEIYKILQAGFKQHYYPGPFINKMYQYDLRNNYIERQIQNAGLKSYVETFTVEDIKKAGKYIAERAKLNKAHFFEIAEDLVRFHINTGKAHWAASDKLIKLAEWFYGGRSLTFRQALNLKHGVRIAKGGTIFVGSVAIVGYALWTMRTGGSDPLHRILSDLNRSCGTPTPAGYPMGCVYNTLKSKDYTPKELYALLEAVEDFARADSE